MAASAGRTRWTTAMEDLLIECWQHYECLYNMSSDTSQNEAQKERDWKEIAVALGLPVEEVKVKAASLQTQYSRLLKPLRSGRSNKAVTPGQKRILSSLHFLEKRLSSRPSGGHLDQSAEGVLSAQQDGDDTKPKKPLDLDSGQSSSPADGGGFFRTAWPLEKEEVFFKLWRQHECLYGMSSKKHWSQHEKEKKWAEIAAVLDIPVAAVKLRASSIRTHYTKLVRPGKKKTPLTARQRQILSSCDFLKKHIFHRCSLHRSVADAVKTQQDSSDSEPENTELSPDPTPSPTESPSVSPPPPPCDEKQPRSSSDGERQKAALLQHVLDIIQEPSRQPERDCEDSFGVTVAMELKRLRSPALRNRVKRQIMTVLYDALDSEQIAVS